MTTKNDPTAIYFSAGVLFFYSAVLTGCFFIERSLIPNEFLLIGLAFLFIAIGCLFLSIGLILKKKWSFRFSISFLIAALTSFIAMAWQLWRNEWVENQLVGLLFLGFSILCLPAILLLSKHRGDFK